MSTPVVITGLGMVTPLGSKPREIWARVRRGEQAAGAPAFDPSPFDCRVCAAVKAFDAERAFPDNKTLRFMNRDAQMAVVAARQAMRDARVVVGETYPSEEIALFGSTGLTGLPADEIRRLVQLSAAADGSLDLGQLGQVALRRVRPVLSFKLLANIPICFVSIFEGLRGENAVYTPWEHHGAQAIAAGVRAIQQGRASCAVVGGCDVKTHEFAFIALQQHGYFESWRSSGQGIVPGEGAAFLVLEREADAWRRGVCPYASIREWAIVTNRPGQRLTEVFAQALTRANTSKLALDLMASGNGDDAIFHAENRALTAAGLEPCEVLRPKATLGDLFAAAPAVQVGLAASWIQGGEGVDRTLATCFSRSSGQAVFALEAV